MNEAISLFLRKDETHSLFGLQRFALRPNVRSCRELPGLCPGPAPPQPEWLALWMRLIRLVSQSFSEPLQESRDAPLAFGPLELLSSSLRAFWSPTDDLLEGWQPSADGRCPYPAGFHPAPSSDILSDSTLTGARIFGGARSVIPPNPLQRSFWTLSRPVGGTVKQSPQTPLFVTRHSSLYRG